MTTLSKIKKYGIAIKQIEAKLAAHVLSGNVPFNAAEMQEHSEKNPGGWKLENQYPNREKNRSTLSNRNMARYMRTHSGNTQIMEVGAGNM